MGKRSCLIREIAETESSHSTKMMLVHVLHFTKLLLYLWMQDEYNKLLKINCISCSKAEIQILILLLPFTKACKCDNIYKLCLWSIEEHSCLIIKALSMYRSSGIELKLENLNFSYFEQNRNNIYIAFMNARRT